MLRDILTLPISSLLRDSRRRHRVPEVYREMVCGLYGLSHLMGIRLPALARRCTDVPLPPCAGANTLRIGVVVRGRAPTRPPVRQPPPGSTSMIRVEGWPALFSPSAPLYAPHRKALALLGFADLPWSLTVVV